MLEYLRDNGESGTKEIKEDRGSLSEGYVDKAIHELKAQGLVERINEGGKGLVVGIKGKP
ncbi:unnamed protein product, partial [marine sediment metagenome]